MSVIESFQTLPNIVNIEGISAEPQVITNGKGDTRLCYSITNISNESKHYKDWDEYGGVNNPLQGGFTGFLLLYTGIETDSEMIAAIEICANTLKEHGLWK